MHPEKQCCPGTSCGVKRINNNLVNICMMCLDIGESCGHDRNACCRGLRCQKVTALSSACIPVSDFRFYPDPEELDRTESKPSHNHNRHHQRQHRNDQNDDSPQQISLASLLML